MSEIIGSAGSIGLGDVSYNVRFSQAMLPGDAQAVDSRYEEIRRKLEAKPILLKYTFDEKGLQVAQKKMEDVISSLNRQIEKIKPIKLTIDTSEVDAKIASATKKITGAGVSSATHSEMVMPRGYGRTNLSGHRVDRLDSQVDRLMSSMGMGERDVSRSESQMARADRIVARQYEKSRKMIAAKGYRADTQDFKDFISSRNATIGGYRKLHKETTRRLSRQAKAIKSYRGIYAQHIRDVEGGAFGGPMMGGMGNGRMGKMFSRFAAASIGRSPLRSMLRNLALASPYIAGAAAIAGVATTGAEAAASYQNMMRNNALNVANASPIGRSQAFAQAYRKDFEFAGNQNPHIRRGME